MAEQTQKEKKQLIQNLRQKFLKEIASAFGKVKRENFLPEEMKGIAYSDTALGIGFGQTISQPSTIAVMLELLDVKPGMNVLEIGSGSGYVLALLHHLMKGKGKLIGVEVVPQLVEAAKKNLAMEGISNAEIIYGDGKQRVKGMDFFDRIIFSCATEEIPETAFEQLKEKGKIVAPAGNAFSQQMHVIEKISGRKKESVLENQWFVFVPLR